MNAPGTNAAAKAREDAIALRDEQQLAMRWQRWRKRFQRHRLSMLIGGGLLGGIALTTVSPRRWSRVGGALFGGSAWLARSAIGPALLSAVWAHLLSRSAAPHASTEHFAIDAVGSSAPRASPECTDQTGFP